MINITQQVLNQILGSQYVSTSTTFSTITPTLVNISGGVLNVNNTDVSTPYLLQPTDQVVVKIVNSNTYATTNYATLTIGTDTYVYSSTTVTDQTTYHLNDSQDVGPFDYLIHPNGFPVVPYSASNKISVFDSGFNLTEIPTASYSTNIDTYPVDVNKELSFIANYTDDSIYVVDNTKTIIGRISLPVGSKPAYLTNQSSQQQILVTLSGTNVVAVIDRNTGTIVHNIVVGTRPMGIVVDSTDNVWVANFESNTVSIISADLSTVTTVVVGNNPLEVVIDSQGFVWVTNSLDDTVSKINSTTHSVTTIPVGINPWGLCSVGNYVYVANSYSDSISKIDITTNAVVDTIATESVPYSIVNYLNNIYVACFDSATVLKITNDIVTHSVPVSKYPFGLSVDVHNNVWMVNFYSNLPTRTYLKKQTPIGFGFLNIFKAIRSTSYQSNVITISGLDEPTPASIPPINNTHLIKNNINVGFNTVVTNGDQLKLSVISDPNYNGVVTTPL